MTSDKGGNQIPVVDVDQTFPLHTSDGARTPASPATGDQTQVVDGVLRDVLGWRPRTQDPKAFVDALSSTFQLNLVEGHVESRYVPRGFAVNAELGAVTGGQASLWSRARAAHTEIARILEGLTPLRVDADPEDMAAYRILVGDALRHLVDELGAAGGPRRQVVDTYFRSLTGLGPKDPPPATPDEMSGQLGALRERFGLIDANVNTVEEEAIRTSFWTLVDLVTDIKRSWSDQRDRFGGAAGYGFLGTDLILLARLMEAGADQVEELESVLDSVLISRSERQTLDLDGHGLTLDGLLSWLRVFLTKEGRRIAQDTGRDGIVSALAPTAVELFRVFKRTLGDRLDTRPRLDTSAWTRVTGDESPWLVDHWPVRYLPVRPRAGLPTGMYAARTRIAVASLSRLLWQLVRTVRQIGRFPGVVLIDVVMVPFEGDDHTDDVHVEIRGLNLRPTYVPAFVKPGAAVRADGRTAGGDDGRFVFARLGSSSADDERMTAVFSRSELEAIGSPLLDSAVVFAAEDIPLAVVDGELGRVIHAPEPTTWPSLVPADRSVQRNADPAVGGNADRPAQS